MRCTAAALVLAAVAAAWDRTHSHLLDRAAVAGLGNPVRDALLARVLPSHQALREALATHAWWAVSWRDQQDSGVCLTLMGGGERKSRIWLDRALNVNASAVAGEHGYMLPEFMHHAACDRDGDGRWEVLWQFGGRIAVFRLTPDEPELVGAWCANTDDLTPCGFTAAWEPTPRGDAELIVSRCANPTIAPIRFRWTRPGGTLTVTDEITTPVYAIEFPDDQPWRDVTTVEAVLMHVTSSCGFGLTPRRATPEVRARWKLLSPEPANASASPNTAAVQAGARPADGAPSP